MSIFTKSRASFANAKQLRSQVARWSCKFAQIVLFGMMVNADQAYAKITLEGTAEEKAELQKAIDEAKSSSAATKTLYTSLEARPQNVVIKFGANKDIAVANTGSMEVIIDKTKLAKMTQVGTGQALEQMTLKYVIVHEALGHIENKLAGKSWGEPAAMATTNQLRKDDKSATRTKYIEVNDGKATIPFSDGSKIDITEALKAPSAGKGKAFAEITEQARIAFRGVQDANSSMFKLDLAQSTPSSMKLLFDGGTSRFVEINGLSLSLGQIAEDPLLPGINLEGSNFGMEFANFIWNGSDTGTNILSMLDPSRTLSGSIGFASSDEFEFDIVGDFGWENALFDNGYAVEHLVGSMKRDADNVWIGSASLSGIKFAVVPEPGTISILLLGLLLLVAASRCSLRRIR